MNYEIPVLFQKIAPDLAKLICKVYGVRPTDLNWHEDGIEFPKNGGKKKIKITLE